MQDRDLSPQDWEWLAKCYRNSVAECEVEGWGYEGEVVMTSVGYVEIEPDGTVAATAPSRIYLGTLNDADPDTGDDIEDETTLDPA